MAHDDLPVNIDASYADDGAHADVKIHQGHHDELHYFHNLFDITDVAGWDNGVTVYYNTGTGKFEVGDPAGGGVGPQGPAGQGFTIKGPWSGATAYVPYDVVTLAGSAFVARTSHTNSTPNSAPADTSNWYVFASKGSDGAAGVDGGEGAKGDKGDPGIPGPSAESRIVDTTVSGTYLIDAAEASYRVLTLTGNATISFDDTSGREVSALTLRLSMGSGGPYTVTWADVGFWQSGSGVAPVLSGMATGELIVLTFDQVDGFWIGYNPGDSGGGTPPAEIFPVLDLEDWVSHQDTTNKIDTGDGVEVYVSSSSYQLGNKRGGVVFVVNTTDDSLDPPIPVLSGAGASAWTQGNTIVAPITGAARRRGTLYYARDATSGALALFTVTLPGASRSHTGLVIRGARTVGAVPDTWVALMASKDVVRKYDDAGETTTTLHCPFAAADDADNRWVIGVFANIQQALTPLESAELMGAVGAEHIQMINPTVRAWIMWNPVSFDTTPSGTFGGPAFWGAVGAEMLQGPTT